MSKARTLADFISDGSEFADGTISVAEVSGAAPIESPTFTNGGDNRLTVAGHGITVDGSITLGTSHNLGDTFPEDDLLVQTGTGKKLLLDGNTGIRLRYGGAQKAFIGSDGISLADNDKVKFGYGDNLQIYYDGTDSVIKDTSDGNLVFTSNGGGIFFRNDAETETYANFNNNGSVQLRYDNAAKFETSSTGVDVTGKTTTDELDLNALAATISDTAVDIFVYDTRKDSDGGAWRKRTQHTSWYNETLNTATRGSRREFPAVAVIVAESNQVTIYDGDDPDLPMWMVFNVTGGGAIFGDNTNVIQSVICLNGWMSVGSTRPSTTGNLSVADFIGDRSGFVYNNASDIRSQGNIADRNSASQYPGGTSNFFTSDPIVNRNVNDVAMTVLPNAPIDAATGLPVPTIAVATDGGVSVITDSGDVYDLTYLLGSTESELVEFDGNGGIFWGGYSPFAGASIHLYWNKTLPTADDNSTPDARYASNENAVADLITTESNFGYNSLSISDIVAAGALNGLFLIDQKNDSPADGMTLQMTSTYNTGWQNGNIKLATLSDTDDTDVTGSELVTNGTFDTDISGWTALRSAVLSHSSGAIEVTNASGVTSGMASQAVTLEVGKTYIYQVTRVSGSVPAYSRIGTTPDGDFYISKTLSSGTSSDTFVATSTTAYISLQIKGGSDGDNVVFDNVSVRLAEEDRSVNGNGLQVFGTVTKNPVNSGADLVAYSGFSGSNYLEQPYNSDMQFGTGNFCIMGWFKATDSGGTQVFFGDYASGTPYTELMILTTTGKFRFNTHDGTTNNDVYSTAPVDVRDNVWRCFAAVKNGSVKTLYLNGVFQSSATLATNNTLTSGHPWRIGNEAGGAVASNTSLALLRVSATVPSPEQIKKIYEDEKHLFQENAQATLYGSSDAVTALAYDDSTELLHVGTSAGRSDFQGLRRVDNTTTAVGAAISASNGLVADE